MNFESFATRIMDFREYSYIDKAPQKIKQKRFQVKKNSHANDNGVQEPIWTFEQ